MNFNIAKENLTLLKDVFEQHNIVFWLAWGTCLGAIREQNFIAHDYDIDIECHRQDKKYVIAIVPELKSLGFTISTCNWSNPKNFNKGIQLKRKGEQIDIFWVEKINTNLWIAAIDELISENFFSNLTEIIFLEEKYKVPSPPEKYLTYVYGANWQRKITDFSWENTEPKKQLVSLKVHGENLRLIKAEFAQYNIPFWLADITCKNAVINNNLEVSPGISINTDVKNQLTVIQQIIPSLELKGFEIFKASCIQGHHTVIYRQNQSININYLIRTSWQKRLQGLQWQVGKSIFMEDFFHQLEIVKYLEEDYYIPGNYQKYLDYLYGALWTNENLGIDSEIELVTKILQEKNEIEIPVKYPFLEYRHHYDNLLIPQGDRLLISPVTQLPKKGTIVLVKDDKELLIRRVIEVNKNNQIELSDEVFSKNNLKVDQKEILGEVRALRSLRLGINIPLNTTIVTLIFKYLKPLLMRLKLP